MTPWSPQWELEDYWDKVMVSPVQIARDRNAFRRDLAHFQPDVAAAGIVVDVGAGPFGVFNEIEFAGASRIVVDPLATVYQERYGVTRRNAELLDAYASRIPLDDDVADQVFCIEALDHCNSVEDYCASAVELRRILKPGGRLFFMIPLRSKVQDGHPIALEVISLDAMEGAFRPLQTLKRKVAETGLYLTLQK